MTEMKNNRRNLQENIFYFVVNTAFSADFASVGVRASAGAVMNKLEHCIKRLTTSRKEYMAIPTT